MKLTPFGLAARTLRMKLDVPLKEMAAAISVSPSHLSGIEYGDKKLTKDHLDAAVAFFRGKATEQELQELTKAGWNSLNTIKPAFFASHARSNLAAFARKLESGAPIPADFEAWLHSRPLTSA